MYQLTIQDPSGGSRAFPLKNGNEWTIGRTSEHAIPFRDPTLPESIGRLFWRESRFEIDLADGVAPAQVAGISIRTGEIPAGVEVRIGETRLKLHELTTGAQSLPSFPRGVKPWLTRSESGVRTLWTVRKAAPTSLPVYLAGETGSGKEVLAHLLHAWSDRAGGPFVPLHCGALPLGLAESELFGHLKGSFTGADRQRPGAILQAHGGTLFLDEIGDLPLEIQVKLLRFLEDGELRAVGADHRSHVNVRVICATHKPLEQLVEEGSFRRDLYYRLASVKIEIPPLRDRPSDIEMLALQFSSAMERTISPQAMLRLKAHPWPGNVRELRHAIERACGLSGPFQSILTETDFAFLMTARTLEKSPAVELGVPVLTLKEMERVMLLKALRLADGHRTRAAEILGIARSTLFEMLKRHGIQGPKAA